MALAQEEFVMFWETHCERDILTQPSDILTQSSDILTQSIDVPAQSSEKLPDTSPMLDMSLPPMLDSAYFKLERARYKNKQSAKMSRDRKQVFNANLVRIQAKYHSALRNQKQIIQHLQQALQNSEKKSPELLQVLTQAGAALDNVLQEGDSFNSSFRADLIRWLGKLPQE